MAKGKTPLNKIPRSEFSDVYCGQDQIGLLAVGVNEQSVNMAFRRFSLPVPTVPTAAGTVEVNFLAPVTGTITGAWFIAKDALATSDTNYVTFALTERGATGAGSTAMLATSPAGTNTSKATGGTALAAYGKYAFNLVGGLTITANDVLSFSVTGAGTLANTLTEGCIALSIVPSS